MECEVHENKFSLICVTCDKFLCIECVDDHQGDHLFKTIKKTAGTVRSEKQNLLRNIEEDVTTLKKEIAAVRATQKQQEDLEKEENQKINDHRAAFHSVIDEIADSQLQFSGQQKMKNISVLQEDEAFLTKQLQERLAYGNTIKDIIATSDDTELLKSKTIRPVSPLSFPPTPFGPLKFCAGQINKDQIRFMFGRMMDSPDEADVVSDFLGSVRIIPPDQEKSTEQGDVAADAIKHIADVNKPICDILDNLHLQLARTFHTDMKSKFPEFHEESVFEEEQVKEIEKYIDKIISRKRVIEDERCKLLQYKENIHYMNRALREKDVTCHWVPKEDQIDVYTVTDRDCTAFSEVFHRNFDSYNLQQVGTDKMRSGELQNVVDKYKENALLEGMGTDDITLISRADVFPKILEELNTLRSTDLDTTQFAIEFSLKTAEFIWMYKQDVIKLIEKKHNVKIMHSSNRCLLVIDGLKDDAEKAKHKLKAYAVQNIANTEFVGKLTQVTSIVRNSEEKTQFEKSEHCVISREKVDKEVTPSMIVKSGTLYIVVTSGDLLDSEADAIICPVDIRWNPILGDKRPFRGIGAVQTSDNKIGNVTVTSCSEELRCSNIMSITLPSQRDISSMISATSVIEKAVDECLCVAVKNEFHSISVPAFITDALSVEACVSALVKSIRDHRNDTCLDEICIYAYNEKEEAIVKKALEIHFKNGPDMCLTDFSLLYEGLKDGNAFLMPHIYIGSMTDVKVDVLVNTTSLTLDLKKGFISSSILHAAGEAIQIECLHNMPKDFSFGDIVITSPGYMKTCKHICHGALPSWDSTANCSLMVLQLFMVRCLEYTDIVQGTSIAFPVLGTGKLGYPWRHVAKTMLETVKEYGRKRGKTTIKVVKIVVFGKDQETQKVFRDLLNTQETRNEDVNFSQELSTKVLEGKLHMPGGHFGRYRTMSSRSIKFQILPDKFTQKTDASVYFVSEREVIQNREFIQNEVLVQQGNKYGNHFMDIFMFNGDSTDYKQNFARMLTIAMENRCCSLQVHAKENEVNTMVINVQDVMEQSYRDIVTMHDWYLNNIQFVVKDRAQISCQFLLDKLDNNMKRQSGLNFWSAKKPYIKWRVVTPGLHEAVKITVTAETSRIDKIIKKLKDNV